jgi:hypothetical protein
MTLADRWLRALRSTDRFAVGRACDYARAEGSADVLDPTGLLAVLAGDSPFSTDGGWRTYERTAPDSDAEHAVNTGAYYAWPYAERLAHEVGLTLDDLHTLCLMTDEGLTGWAAANWAERMMEVRRGA